MRVTLDLGEVAVATVLATMRHTSNRASSVGNARVGDQSDLQTDLDGVKAEIAFAKWRNVCPDLSVSPRAGGIDARLDKWTVDVKATRHRNGKLLATPGKRDRAGADVYVLAIVEEECVEFPGWAFAHELLDDSNLTDLGHGPTYALPQSRLRPWKKAAA